MPIEVERKELDSGVTVLAVSGRMTMGNQLQHFEWEVGDLVKNQRNRIVLDMSRMSHLDSAAIGVLVSCHSVVKNSGGQLRLAGVTDHVRGLFKMTGIHDLLNLDPTRDDSVAALATSA